MLDHHWDEIISLSIVENKIKAERAGAINAIINGMRKHIDNGNLCLYGCHAIGRIAMNGKYLFQTKGKLGS